MKGAKAGLGIARSVSKGRKVSNVTPKLTKPAAGDNIGVNLRPKGKDEGVIYKRSDKNGGEYIGQAKSDDRFKARQKEHDRSNPDAEYKFKEVGRAKPGKDLDVLEQKKINQNGGLQKNGGNLQNKRNQISEKKWKQYGIDPPNMK